MQVCFPVLQEAAAQRASAAGLPALQLEMAQASQYEEKRSSHNNSDVSFPTKWSLMEPLDGSEWEPLLVFSCMY
jgi:hypothetical protein